MPAFFQRFINNILKDFIASGRVIVYMDDITIASSNFDDHLEVVQQVLLRLYSKGLELNLKSVNLVTRKLNFLDIQLWK